VGPEVRLREPVGDLTYDFDYVPTYQAYSRFASLDDWDQLVNATVKYQLGLNTAIQFRDLFDYAPAASSFFQQLTTPQGVPSGTQVVNIIGRYNILINSASIDLQHSFSELWRSEVTVTSFYYDPRVTDGITQNITTAAGNLTYAITQRDFVGAGLNFTDQNFGSSSVQNGSTTYFYNVSAVWNHQFSPTWTLNAQAGPTYAETSSVSVPLTTSLNIFPLGSLARVNNVILQPPSVGLLNLATCHPNLSGLVLLSSCNTAGVFPAFSIPLLNVVVTKPTPSEIANPQPVGVTGISQGSQNTVTYFANIVLSKQWETVTGSLGYSRSAGASGVFNSSTTTDAVSGTLTWNASPLWSTSLSLIWTDQSTTQTTTVGSPLLVVGGFSNYMQTGFTFPTGATQPVVVKSVVVQQANSTLNVYQFIIGLHSEYKITKRLKVFGNVFFLNQTSAQQGGQAFNLSSLDYNATRIDLGFHYEFDPIHLWR
jgi:hypothetical protein